MKRTNYIMLLLALAAMSALAAGAQDTNTGGTSAPANVKSSSKSKSSGGTSLTGCLNGPNAENAYMLTTARFKKGVEVGMPASDELSKHVGHKVKLTGSWVSNGADIGEKQDEAAEKAEKKTKKEAAERHFKVTKIDHIADSCTMGGSGKTGATTHKMSKGAITNANTDDKVTKKEQEQQKSASTPK